MCSPRRTFTSTIPTTSILLPGYIMSPEIHTTSQPEIFVSSPRQKPPMNHDRTYRPVPYVPAPRLRDADGSMRQAPCRSAGHAATHPVQPLKGLPGTRATAVSYRALAPGGTCWPRGCAVLPSFGPWRGWLLTSDLCRRSRSVNTMHYTSVIGGFPPARLRSLARRGFRHLLSSAAE